MALTKLDRPQALDTSQKLSSSSNAFWAGLKAGAPLLIGVFPFAVIAGSVAVSKGLTTGAAFGFSIFIFAGASQLAALELIGNQAPIFIVIFTAWMVNLRFIIYSAAIAPYFRQLSSGRKLVIAYLLTDQAFVISQNHYETNPGYPRRRWYFLGVALGLWVTWQLGSAVGILLGAKVPPSLSLDFAVPLSFIALVVPSLKDRSSMVAGLVAGLGVLGLAWMPYNLGFVVAVFCGIGAGVFTERIGT